MCLLDRVFLPCGLTSFVRQCMAERTVDIVVVHV